MNQPEIRIRLIGALLFLFIPLVLFLFLRIPFGIIPSVVAATVIMFSHRFIAVPFVRKHSSKQCLWCCSAIRPRATMEVNGFNFEICKSDCLLKGRQFFDFCDRHQKFLRIFILLPLVFYVVTMLLQGFKIVYFPIEWDRLIFQFPIAVAVLSLSFFYKRGNAERIAEKFPFPVHNLFLLGIRNTLLVFRVVGVYWFSLWIGYVLLAFYIGGYYIFYDLAR